MNTIEETEIYNGLEEPKRLFREIAKGISCRIKERFADAKMRHCYADFSRGVYQVRLSLHEVIINRTFDLWIYPEVILESLDDELDELEEIEIEKRDFVANGGEG